MKLRSYTTIYLGVQLSAVFTILCHFAQAQAWEVLDTVSADKEISLNDAFFVDSLTGWVVGDIGLIAKTSDGGKTWQEQESGVETKLLGLHMESREKGWIVGEIYSRVEDSTVTSSGKQFFSTTDGGNEWAGKNIRMVGGPTDIYFANEIVGWVIGNGEIAKTIDGGLSWEKNPEDFGDWLKDIHFVNNTKGWVVGGTNIGIIYKTGDAGNEWNKTEIDEYNPLNAVYFIDDMTGLAIGEEGIILKTSDGGESWKAKPSGTNLNLLDIDFHGSIGWIVGEDGIILKTQDKGESWRPIMQVIEDNLIFVEMMDSLTGRIITENGTVLQYNKDRDILPVKHEVEYPIQYTDSATAEDREFIENALKDRGAYFIKDCELCDENTSMQLETWGAPDLIDLEVIKQRVRSRANVDTLENKYEIDITPWLVSDVKLWEKQETNTSADFIACHFADSSYGWAIDEFDILIKTVNGGKEWKTIVDFGLNRSKDVFFIDSLTGWTVGFGRGDGAILKTSDGGITWSEIHDASREDNWYWNVHFTSEEVGWVIEKDKNDIFVLLKTEDGGENWIEQYAEPHMRLEEFFFLDNLNGWITGTKIDGGNFQYKFILKTSDGKTWTEQRIPNYVGTSDLHFINESTGWTVGTSIYKTDNGGLTWSKQAENFDNNYYTFNSISFIDSLNGWVVGRNGVILSTNDGGANWIRQPSGTNQDLHDVFFVATQKGWVVGKNGIILQSDQHNSEEIYRPREGATKVTVGIIDTGVKTNHYLLQNALWVDGWSFGTECEEKKNGYNVIYNSVNIQDINGHGTSVNGAIVRDFPNDVGLELMNLKAFEGSQGSIMDAVCAIYYAISKDVDIINLSWGINTDEFPKVLYDALSAARDDGILVITSAGNDGTNNDNFGKYPANFDLDNIISVTAYEEQNGYNDLAEFANYGEIMVDIAAEGFIETSNIYDDVSSIVGTSMAAPQVTRTAAIIMGMYPKLTYQQVRDCLFSTTNSLSVSCKKEIRYGILNYEAALACAQDKYNGKIAEPEVERFILHNIDANRHVQSIMKDSIYSLEESALSKFNISVDIAGDNITRVELSLIGAIDTTITEIYPPFSLFGQVDGRYLWENAKVGDYTLVATPFYLNSAAIEVAGESDSIEFSFTVSDEPRAEENILIYPNPTSRELVIVLEEVAIGESYIALYDLKGAELLKTEVKHGQLYCGKLDLSILPKSIYILKVVNDSNVYSRLVIKRNE